MLNRTELTQDGKNPSPDLHPCHVPDLGPEFLVETGQALPEEWGRILNRFDDANLCQTWQYASTRWGSNKVGHVVLKRENEIVAAAQVIYVKLPVLPVGMAYVKWGPVWQPRSSPGDPNDLRTMLVALRHIYVHRAHLLLRVTPWEFDDVQPRSLFATAGFAINNEREQLRTAVLDLSYPMEKLRESLSRHWRYNLKQAQNNALELCEGFTDDLCQEFMTLYQEMRNRKKEGEIPQMNYLPHVQRELPPEAKLRVTICRHNGVPIAGLIVSALGSKAFAVAAATGSAGLEMRGSYLLQWRMVEWLKTQGVRWYDLARINEKTHPGTTQFKLGLCGKLGSTVAYLGDFEACENRISHLLVGAADSARHFLGKAKVKVLDRAPHWKEATP